MAWYPIGPRSVFAPRDINYLRLSRRNEYTAQSAVTSLAVVDDVTLYAVARPDSGGTSVWRSDDDGESWTSLFDVVHQAAPPHGGVDADPVCVTVRRLALGVEAVFVGSGAKRRLYWSFDRGESWASADVGARVEKILIDPASAADPARPERTGLYLATDRGVLHLRSITGIPSLLLAGRVTSLVAHLPAAGTASWWAGIDSVGLYHASDPAGAWTLMNTGAAGMLPTPAVRPFSALRVAFAPRNAERVYVWAARPYGSSGSAWFYTTGGGATGPWTEIAVPVMGAPKAFFRGGPQNLYNFVLAVSPNSPGDGARDILFLGEQVLWRSRNAGRTWQWDHGRAHADFYDIAFRPAPVATDPPVIYVANDGGVEKSSGYAADEGTFEVDAPEATNSGATVSDRSTLWQNLSHGLAATAAYGYGADPTAAAAGYVGSLDTGIAAGSGAATWRSAGAGDHGVCLAQRGPDGMTVWTLGGFEDWPTFPVLCYTDHGTHTTSVAVRLSGVKIGSSSHFVLEREHGDGDRGCVVGAIARDVSSLLLDAVAAPGIQTVRVTSTAEIVLGGRILVDDDPRGPNYCELLTVDAVDAAAGTIRASFDGPHAARVTLRVQRSLVVRIDRAGAVVPLSQNLGGRSHEVFTVAPSPADDLLACATRRRSYSQSSLGPAAIDDAAIAEQRVFVTAGGSRAQSTWIEAVDFPAGGMVASLAASSAGQMFALLLRSVSAAGVTTPLFRLERAGAGWRLAPETCVAVPADAVFGRLLADPDRPDVLYASHGGRVYRMTRAGGTWTWADISDGAAGLPGRWIVDLWLGNIAPPGRPRKLLLRASTGAGDVWEKDVSDVPVASSIMLYVRDHFLDDAWLDTSLDGVANPFRPSERLWHWQSPDVKVEVEQAAGGARFFQSSLVYDPSDLTRPLRPVYFDMLREREPYLREGAPALVHVEVHNRARVSPARPVWVWALFCRYAGMLPALDGGRPTVRFWDQFTPGGIYPALPTDASFPWAQVGPPKRVLGPLDAAHPAVVSWPWTIPRRPAGDEGHYCIAVFVHAVDAPIGESTRVILDEITPTNRQVTHRNVQVGPPPGRPGGSGMAGGGAFATGPGAGGAAFVDFNNPLAQPLSVSLVFDLKSLPADARPRLRLAGVERNAPMSGVELRREPGLARLILNRVARLLVKLGIRCPWEPAPRFDPTVYQLKPGTEARIDGVEIGPHGKVSVWLDPALPAGATPASEDRHVDLLQLVDGKILGGATYVIPGRPVGRQPPSEESTLGSPRLRVSGFLSPWMIEALRPRGEEQVPS